MSLCLNTKIRQVLSVFVFFHIFQLVYGRLLRNEHDFIATQSNKDVSIPALEGSDFLYNWMGNTRDDLTTRVMEALEDLPNVSTDVGKLCLNHTEIFLEALARQPRQPWALRCK